MGCQKGLRTGIIGPFSLPFEVIQTSLIHILIMIIIIIMIIMIVWVVRKVIWRPYALQRIMRSQGVEGAPYHPFFGNLFELKALIKEATTKRMDLSHHLMPRLIPYYQPWAKLYGKPFLFWFGWRPRLVVSDPQLIKEVLLNKCGHFEKIMPSPYAKQLGGGGLGALEGELWAHHKRVINPAFHAERLKGMMATMVGCTKCMLGRWKKLVESGEKVVEMYAEFGVLTGDVISQTVFNSSYAEGKRVFEIQRQQMIIAAESFRFPYIPGSRFLPTPKNIHSWKLDQEMKEAMLKVIRRREQEVAEQGGMGGFGKDLLGLMMTAHKGEIEGGHIWSLDEIIDECKAFYFVGAETTSTLLTWAMMALGVHTNYQNEARAEVFRVCGDSPPNPDSINNLKLVTMIIYETLRLYPPAIMLHRRTSEDVKLGNMMVPKGVELALMFMAAHHDKDIWGEDALMFKPERFTHGVARAAKTPFAFMPFSMGSRVCIGHNFAMQEARIALAMILQNYSFVISPSYWHAPTSIISLQPQFGVHVLLEPVNIS